jgi:hypothetical protein
MATSAPKHVLHVDAAAEQGADVQVEDLITLSAAAGQGVQGRHPNGEGLSSRTMER